MAVTLPKIDKEVVKIKEVTISGSDANLFNSYLDSYNKQYGLSVDASELVVALALSAIKSDKAFMKDRK